MKQLFKKYQEITRYDEPMSRHTSFQIGGSAEVFVTPKNTQQLQEVYQLCLKKNLPVFTLGNGTNILVKDAGIKGVVLKMASRNIRIKDDIITVDAGYSLAHLVARSIKSGLTGLEALAGIPGSVGGAVIMNAGGKYGYISDAISLVRVIDQKGNEYGIKKPQLRFGYRTSNLKSKFIALGIEFQLKPSTPQRVKTFFQEILAEKDTCQPLAAKSAGCIFKNPSGGATAGELIEKAGLKGTRLGGAMVSVRHANFIINTANASAQNILDLIEKVRETVYHESGVNLKLEIEIWG